MKNLALNAMSNVKVFNVGAGNKEEQVAMEVRTPSNRGANRITKRSGQDVRMVPIVKLDDYPPIHQMNKIHLMKIDVEGYDLQVLRGAERLLRTHKPTLFIELDENNLRDQGESATELIEFLSSLGYQNIVNAESGTRISPADNFTNCHYDIIAS